MVSHLSIPETGLENTQRYSIVYFPLSKRIIRASESPRGNGRFMYHEVEIVESFYPLEENHGLLLHKKASQPEGYTEGVWYTLTFMTNKLSKGIKMKIYTQTVYIPRYKYQTDDINMKEYENFYIPRGKQEFIKLIYERAVDGYYLYRGEIVKKFEETFNISERETSPIKQIFASKVTQNRVGIREYLKLLYVYYKSEFKESFHFFIENLKDFLHYKDIRNDILGDSINKILKITKK